MVRVRTCRTGPRQAAVWISSATGLIPWPLRSPPRLPDTVSDLVTTADYLRLGFCIQIQSSLLTGQRVRIGANGLSLPFRFCIQIQHLPLSGPRLWTAPESAFYSYRDRRALQGFSGVSAGGLTVGSSTRAWIHAARPSRAGCAQRGRATGAGAGRRPGAQWSNHSGFQAAVYQSLACSACLYEVLLAVIPCCRIPIRDSQQLSSAPAQPHLRRTPVATAGYGSCAPLKK